MTTDAPFTKGKFLTMLIACASDCRRLQKVYFSTRSDESLKLAKEKEKQLDFLLDIARKFCYFE